MLNESQFEKIEDKNDMILEKGKSYYYVEEEEHDIVAFTIGGNYGEGQR